MTCRFEENLKTLQEASRGRDDAISNYDFKLTNFFTVARCIDPCGCAECRSNRVLRKLSGEPYPSFLHHIADVGWHQYGGEALYEATKR